MERNRYELKEKGSSHILVSLSALCSFLTVVYEAPIDGGDGESCVHSYSEQHPVRAVKTRL